MLNLIRNKNIISIIISTIVFQIIYGLKVLNPKNTDWIMSAYHDWGQHYLGAAYYRNESWQFPLGEIKNFYFPVGTNVGFMDSIPIMALFTKVFSGILPENFQYLGIWLFICVFFLAYYTFKICTLFRTSFFLSIITVILVVLNPVFIFRGIHPALSSHFLILASIYYYLIKTNNNNSRKINIYQVIIIFIASTINPYLTLMIFGFNVALPLKHYFIEKSINLKQLFFFPIISIFLVLFFWIIFGMIQFKTSTDLASVDSFNLYSFNLNSFYNSYGYFSKFLTNYGFVSDKQYEGFAYFGLGIILLIILSLLIILFNIKRDFLISFKKFIPIVIICFIQFLFAITNQITFNDKILLEFPIPSIIEKLGFIFRASGRFVWPLYYLIFIFSIFIFFKSKLKFSLKIIIICLITIIQIYDIQHLITFRDLENDEYNPPINQEKWISIFKNFDEVITYPPFETSLNYTMDYQDLCLIALKANKPISDGYVARSNIDDKNKFIESVENDINSNQNLEGRLYVTTAKYLQDFSSLLNNDYVSLKKRDKYFFIYDSRKKIDILFQDDDRKYIDSLRAQFKSIYKTKETNKVFKETNDIKFYIDKLKKEKFKYFIEGWGFVESSMNNSKDSIFIVLKSDSKQYLISTKMYPRPDITMVYKKENLNNSGFKITLSNENIQSGEYSLGILIKNNDKSLHFKTTNEKIVIPEKKNVFTKSKMELDLNTFDAKNKSNQGIAFYENSSAISSNISLEKGDYMLVINGLSYPETPINGENAHFKIKLGNILKEIYLSNDFNKKENYISFNLQNKKTFKLEFTFDNDITVDNKDRNAIISSIHIYKKD